MGKKKRHIARLNIQSVTEGPDWEKRIAADTKHITPQDMAKNVSQYWKDRVAKKQISVPIPGTNHYT